MEAKKKAIIKLLILCFSFIGTLALISQDSFLCDGEYCYLYHKASMLQPNKLANKFMQNEISSYDILKSRGKHWRTLEHDQYFINLILKNGDTVIVPFCFCSYEQWAKEYAEKIISGTKIDKLSKSGGKLYEILHMN